MKNAQEERPKITRTVTFDLEVMEAIRAVDFNSGSLRLNFSDRRRIQLLVNEALEHRRQLRSE